MSHPFNQRVSPAAPSSRRELACRAQGDIGDEARSHCGNRWTAVSQLATGPEKLRCKLGLGRQTEPSPHFRTGQSQTNARVPNAERKS